MRLSKIKLAGFKSFVDPTTINFPSNLVAVVGPNGCGKSNVIDAIRWVMGESSAKHLRGDSMADVIFNGSASRKPLGVATIELFFDNSDGAIGGQYAQYNEVCIKRSVSRDGTSQYFLNNVRCRRKDITGIFLGTGLGPRSYAIIEQGMISRLIDAKPDEMRVYIEEAAGISKYKERRRETEHRIRHTRDNLDRLNDLRDEIENQIKHLQRQAKQAERYKELKQEERSLEAEVLGIRLTDLQTQLENQQLEFSQAQTQLEAAVAEQRGIEAEIESARQKHIEATDTFNATQGNYYAVQSEISRLEQSISHSHELTERQAQDLTQTQEQLSGVSEEIDQDRAQLQELEATLESLAPGLAEARASEEASAKNLKRVETALEEWQKSWHAFNLESKEYQQISHVERARIEQIDERLIRLRDQQVQLSREQDEISITELERTVTVQTGRKKEAQELVSKFGKQLEEIDRQIAQLRDREQQLGGELEKIRSELESRRGRVETLEALQEAAFGEGKKAVKNWISQEKLADRPRLAQQLDVDKPWERAVETVLGDFLQAICVKRSAQHMSQLPQSEVILIDSDDSPGQGTETDGYLSSKVRNAGSMVANLNSVRLAKNLDEAIQLRDKIGPDQSVITPDGIWLGHGWVRVNRGRHEVGGLISREQDIRELRKLIEDYEDQVGHLDNDRRECRDRLAGLEVSRRETNGESNDANRRLVEVSTILSGLQQDFERIKDRLNALIQDEQSVRDEIESLETAIKDSQVKLTHAAKAIKQLDERSPGLQDQQEGLLQEHERAQEKLNLDRDEVTRINVEYESGRASRESAYTSLTRISTQQQQLESRIAALTEEVEGADVPMTDLKKELEGQLEQEVIVDRDLNEHRQRLEGAETELRDYETGRAECEKKVAEARDALDGQRIGVRETEVRREGLAEQFSQTGLELESVLSDLAEDATLDQWEERLTVVRRRIDRLGAINLAAIDEFSEQTERKKYLDAQWEDLTAALETLEGAIRKIDRETRTRFRETFDNVNAGLKRLFPRLFGGGHAYLSMEGEDLLNSGVSVMARPPGKRNSHIHLLSGGEKALTAVALIFSIFELNPAPFCLLDEVDAPLDEANVMRFCDIVRDMSGSVQFLIITHNKATMEMASQLTGVTMNEPGVSRLVSVDIDEAVKIAG